MQIRHLQFAAFAAVVVATASGCPSCASDQVGAGVARLTIRNVGAMTTLVNADDNCGFASAAVQDAAVVDGEPGGNGSITLTVDGCEIDAGKSTDVGAADCNGKKTTAEGKVKISATRTISGFLTGDAQNPIIPATADSLVITISKAEFTNFAAHAAGSDDFLIMNKGSISAKVSPRLAVAASSGACAIATPNTSFTDVKYAASTVHVDTPDNKFDADVATSNIAAQNGNGPGGENAISGKVTVFGNEVDAAGPDGDALDPDYKAGDFVSSYSCTDDLADPESYDCGEFIDDQVQVAADGAARLTIQMLGTITSIVDADTDCGFASAGVLGAPDVSGDTGGSGTITTTVTNCTIDLTDALNGSDDCNGDHSIAQGSITVSGTKAVTGRLTGNNDTPVIPDDDHPATFTFSAITVDHFTVSSSSSNNSLTANSGTLSGAVTPRTAATDLASDSQGACAIATPNAHFANVAWDGAELVVSGDAGSLTLPVNAAALNAVNGNFDASTNSLTGSMTVAGNVLSVPSDNAGLNPDFDQNAFDASWQCNPDLADPVSFQCKFVAPIGIGAAQLSAQLFGTIVSLIDANNTCGFSSAAVGGTPAFTAGSNVGDDDVEATFSLDAAGCVIDIANATVISTNCVGDTTSFAGQITVKGTKKVTGWRTGDPAEPVVPSSSTPAQFDLQIDLAHTEVTTNPAGPASFIVHSGNLAGTARPVVALDPTTNACSIGTPNIQFADLVWTGGDVTLVAGGNSFNMALDGNTGITATNGTFGADTNTLGGDINVDGIDVPVGGPLNPAFDQVAFDAAYQCAANGSPVLVPDAVCSFRQVLGNAAARLLVKAAGIAASGLKANNVCGFSAPAVVGGAAVTGNPGTVGQVVFTAGADCGTAFPQEAIAATCDADGDTAPDFVTHFIGAGYSTTAATLTVQGLITGQAANPVLPLAQGAAQIDVTAAAFDGAQFFDIKSADGSFQAKGTFTGALDATLKPQNGVSLADTAAAGGPPPDVFSESTPVAQFEGVSTDGAEMVIEVPGAIPGVTTKQFHITINSALIDAVNGSFSPDGGTTHLSNSISGDITVDGEAVTLDPVLVSGFTQVGFDAEYASCDADLQAAITP